jgi:hypothetical protein
MANNDLGFDPQVFSDMQSGNPYATYRKTILGKVNVAILDPFTMKPEMILLEGEPKTDERARIDIWSEMADLYFRRSKPNTTHFLEGTLIKITKEVRVDPHNIEQYSDSELQEVLKFKYVVLSKTLSDITTAPVLMRMTDLAREMELSKRITDAIETRLSEVQLNS